MIGNVIAIFELRLTFLKLLNEVKGGGGGGGGRYHIYKVYFDIQMIRVSFLTLDSSSRCIFWGQILLNSKAVSDFSKICIN